MDPQPNINKVSGAFKTSSIALATAATEIGLFANVPAFNDGQRILDAIQRLNASITSMDQRLTASIDDLRIETRNQFDSLKLRVTTE